MADTGWKSPGTVVSDSSIGTGSWENPSNATASDDSRTNWSSTAILGSGENVTLTDCKLVKADVIGGTSQGDGTIVPITSTNEAYLTIGGSSNLWGNSLSESDVENSGFGVVFAIYIPNGDFGSTTAYLKATNFNVSVPDGATINGVEARIETYVADAAPLPGFQAKPYVDHIQIKVYYTESGTDTNDSRSATTHGSLDSNSARSSFTIGGDGRYVEDFSTTTFRDNATTASWTGDGDAEMDTT